MKEICKICHKSDYKQSVIGRHIQSDHKEISVDKYYLKYMLGDSIKLCPNCNSPTKFQNMTRGYHKYCSLSCRSKVISNTPDAKKIASERGRNSLIKLNSNPEFRLAASVRMKIKMSDPVKSANVRAAASKSLSLRMESPEFKTFVGGRRGKKGWYQSTKVGRIFYGSTYELAAYKLLDDMSSVIGYVKDPIKVPYTDVDGKVKNYYPDLSVSYADGKVEIIEIKPFKLVNDPTVQAKASAAQVWCSENGSEYKFWTESEIFSN